MKCGNRFGHLSKILIFYRLTKQSEVADYYSLPIFVMLYLLMLNVAAIKKLKMKNMKT